ncbi:MAG: hypothetical protein DUW69_001149 [Verrucomicrobia bacterium]|jgi:hypothetical protein|nr:MAG: hypothetical protein DUW69_001149 [Verrucomicrobiota bacterium]
MNLPDPLRDTVRWLSAHARFPASRLETKAETLLCVAALAAAEEAAALAGARHLIQSRDGAKDAASRAYAFRRSKVHYVCDNSAKV